MTRIPASGASSPVSGAAGWAWFAERGEHLVGVLTECGGRPTGPARSPSISKKPDASIMVPHRSRHGRSCPGLEVRVHQHIVGLEDRRADDAAFWHSSATSSIVIVENSSV